MTKKDIINLTKEGEGYNLEFKENVSKKINIEVVAFLNGIGGKILIGVNDKGKIVGTDISNKERANLQNIINQIEPRIKINIEVIDNIIVVNVPEGSDKPYSCSDGYYLRVGAMCQKMNRNEIQDFLEENGKIQYDRMLNREANYPEDFDEEAYNKFLKLSNISNVLKKEELLVNLKCLEKIDNKYLFTNAGVIFFAKNPTRFMIQDYVTCISFKGQSRTYILDTLDLKKDIISNIEDAIQFVKKNIHLTYLINDDVMRELGRPTRKEVLEIPESAIKEAIVNGVCHRQYSEYGARVMVEVSDDKVSIVSPGGVPKGLTKENFGKRSIVRNPIIADLLARVNLIEKSGTGIKRMREDMESAGLKDPSFEYDTFFEVSFLRPSFYDKNYGTYDLSMKKDTLVNYDLNKTQIKMLELISENPKITTKEMANNLNLDLSSISKNLKLLKIQGIIERKGATKKGIWLIKK